MERKYSIDILRIISAITVIIIHVIACPILYSPVEIEVSLISTLELLLNLMKWCVPVFFMITGYCWLKREECTYTYCLYHVLKYICVLFTVGLFYALLEEVFVVRTINFSVITKSVLNVISGKSWDFLWFVYSIIGIYLVMPIIHHFMQREDKDIWTLTALLFIFNILFPTIKEWVTIGVTFPFGGYLFYVCLGGIIAKLKIDEKKTYIIYLMGLLSFVWIVLGNRNSEIGYKHVAVCLMAISIFLFVSKMNIKPNALLLCVSKCTWGMYLIHPFFINAAVKVLEIDFLTSFPYIKLFVFAVIVSFASFITTYTFRKIPLIKRLF